MKPFAEASIQLLDVNSVWSSNDFNCRHRFKDAITGDLRRPLIRWRALSPEESTSRICELWRLTP